MLSFLKVVSNSESWAVGGREQEVSCGKRPCSEQGSEPGYILEIRRVSLSLNNGQRPRVSTRPDVSQMEDRRWAAHCSALKLDLAVTAPEGWAGRTVHRVIYVEVSSYLTGWEHPRKGTFAAPFVSPSTLLHPQVWPTGNSL